MTTRLKLAITNSIAGLGAATFALIHMVAHVICGWLGVQCPL